MGASVSCDTPVPLRLFLNSRTQPYRPMKHSPPNGIMITDILEQRHPRCTCIPIIRYCHHVWSSIAPVKSYIHRVLDGCSSNGLQRRYYGRVRGGLCMDVRERCHFVGRWFWPQSSCESQLVVGVEFKMVRLKRLCKSSTEQVDPFLVSDLHLETVHDGHDDNPCGNPS